MSVSLGDNFDLTSYIWKIKSYDESIKPKLTNCKNCGAILHYEGSRCKCQYCNTEYGEDRIIVSK